MTDHFPGGTWTLQVFDVRSGYTGTFNSWTLHIIYDQELPDAATHFAVSAPASATAGTAQDITVTALNACNQPDVNYQGTVHFTSSDSQAVLPADYTFTPADQGVKTISATLKTAGSQTVAATDTANGSITGNDAIQVNHAAAAVYDLTTTTTSIVAGKSFNVALTAFDAYGNVATGYIGTVHFTSTDTEAVLPANYTYVAGDQGVKTFSVKLKTPGNQTVTATDTVNGALTDGVTVEVLRAGSAPANHEPSPPPTALP